jgi:hypothetical protein
MRVAFGVSTLLVVRSFVCAASSSFSCVSAFANASRSFTVESPPPAEVARIGNVSVFGCPKWPRALGSQAPRRQ